MSTTPTLSDAEVLRDVSLRLTRRLRKYGGFPLSMSQLSVLSVLARHDTTRVGDLARREGVGKSTITRVVSRLELRGLISRRPDPADRRSYLVALTAPGAALLREANRKSNAFLTAELSRLDEADQAAITAALPALDRLVRLKR